MVGDSGEPGYLIVATDDNPPFPYLIKKWEPESGILDPNAIGTNKYVQQAHSPLTKLTDRKYTVRIGECRNEEKIPKTSHPVLNIDPRGLAAHLETNEAAITWETVRATMRSAGREETVVANPDHNLAHPDLHAADLSADGNPYWQTWVGTDVTLTFHEFPYKARSQSEPDTYFS